MYFSSNLNLFFTLPNKAHKLMGAVVSAGDTGFHCVGCRMVGEGTVTW